MLSVERRYSDSVLKMKVKIGVCDERWTDVFKKIKNSIKYKFITFDKLQSLGKMEIS